MEAKKLKLSQLIENKDNPRQITSEKLDKLVDSILTFPEMLEARPIVVDEKYNVLGGNMRLRALNIIANTPIDDLMTRIKSIEQNEDKHPFLHNYWSKYENDVSVLFASELTEEQCKEFMIKDNVSFGMYDFNKLNEVFTKEELDKWGLEVDYDINVDSPLDVDDGDITFEEEFNSITDEDAKLPIVPKFTEKHECFVITVDNKIDEAYIRDKFGLDENYVSDSGDGKIRKTNVISIDKIRDLWK